MASVSKSKALVLHGGGPTAVLNASLAGVVQECRRLGVCELYGAGHGTAGILDGRLFDLYAEDDAFWDRAAEAPGSLLGTSRRKIGAGDYEGMLAAFRDRGIGYVFANGGNGTMEMAHGLCVAAEAAGMDLRVIGIPKTIDNDLAGTDHTPGYPSAARFFAHALRDIGADNRALPGVTVVEILGRNAGWLAAATSLARNEADDAPHLIYFPERPLPFARLAADVETVYRRLGRAVVAVCEGQLDDHGQCYGADARASSRAPLALNLAHVLAQKLAAELGIAARSEKPGLLGRSCSALASAVDRAEARLCGAAAVRAALEGDSGKMIALLRRPGLRYECDTAVIPLASAAGKERLFPFEWLPADSDGPLDEFRAWAEPLVGPTEPWPQLRPNLRRTYII